MNLIKRIEKMGCVFLRHGGNHDWYHNPKTKASQPIPGIEKLRIT